MEVKKWREGTGVFKPSESIHTDLLQHLPRLEREAPGTGLGAFRPLIRLTGLNEDLVKALRTSSSAMSGVLDGQLKDARECSLSTRLGLLCYEALVHNKERRQWHLGYSAYRIPKMVGSPGLFHPLPSNIDHPVHVAWQEEESPFIAHAPVTATFGWMVAAGQRNTRAAHWFRVLRLFEQQARAEARAHLFRVLSEDLLSNPVLGARYRPSPEDWSGFKPQGAVLGRVTSEIMACLHLEAIEDIDERGREVVAWHGQWNKRVKGAVLGAVLVKRLNRMWERLHGAHLHQHHGTAVGGRPTLDVLTERALDDPTVRTSYLRLGMRFGALTLHKLKGEAGLKVWMRKPRVVAALREHEHLDLDGHATTLEIACARYLARAEQSKMTLTSQETALLGRIAPSLAQKGDLKPQQLVQFNEGFLLWDIPEHHEESNEHRSRFHEQRKRIWAKVWSMKEELTRQHHAYVLELSEPN